MGTEILCIFHANCLDGFASRFVVETYYKDEADTTIAVTAATHGQDPPYTEAAGKDVVIVDFSYPKEQILKLAEVAKSVLVLDYHLTSEAELAGFIPLSRHTTVDIANQGTPMGAYPHNIRVLFNMDRSGVGIAWGYYFPDEFMPRMFQHVQDRDLWIFGLKLSKEVCAALHLYPRDYDTWTMLLKAGCDDLIREGTVLVKSFDQNVKTLIRTGKFYINVCGYEVPILNVPPMYASEAGHIMSEREPFAICYWCVGSVYQYSLRSSEHNPDHVNVSEIATRFGGGGHRHAAGFRVDTFPPVCTKE